MNRRILLIDADPAFRATLSQQLGRYRFAVHCEPDADEALSAGAMNPPAVIVVAVEEPDKAGFKVFQRIKKSGLAKTPILLITATVPAESFAKHRGLKVHADDYLDKRTLGQHELVDKIGRLVGELGEPSEDDLDIPVEVDDIALSDGDLVVDETVGDDDAAGYAPPARAAGGEGRVDSLVAAETDAAFDALLGGGFGDEPPTTSLARSRGEVAGAAAAAESGPTALLAGEAALAASREAGRPAPEDDFDTFSSESVRPPIMRTADFGLAARERAAADASATAVNGGATGPVEPEPYESAPAMVLDAEDLQPLDDEVTAVPGVDALELAARPPVGARAGGEPAGARPRLDTPTTGSQTLPPPVGEVGRATIPDLGLELVAQDAESEQSGVYDRRALRKIGELERQIAQLKTELDRMRATAEAVPRGGREREFLGLREQIIAGTREQDRLRGELAARDRELADAREQLTQAVHGRAALETRAAELEQRTTADGGKLAALEARERSVTGQLAAVQQEADGRGQALAAAEAARGQLERDLANERALRAASASDAERALRVEREQLMARHQGELAAARQELAQAQHAAADAVRAEREQLSAIHHGEQTALRRELAQAQAGALDAQRRELEAVHAVGLAAAVDAARAEAAADGERAVGELETQHVADLQRLAEDHLAATGRLTDERDAALARIGPERDAAVAHAIAALAHDHASELAAASRAHAAAVGELERDRDARVDAARREAAAALADAEAAARRERADALAAAEHEHGAELARLAAQERELTSNYEAQLAHQAVVGEARLRQQASEAEAGLQAAAEAHAATQREAAAAIADLEAELARARETAAAELATAAAARERVIAEANAELDRVRAALAHAAAAHEHELAEQAHRHATELAEQANQHAAALAARERELVAQREDDARAQARALAEVREELERQAEGHGLSLEGARRELAEAIALHEANQRELADDSRRAAAEQAAGHAAELAKLAEDKQRAIDDIQRAAADARAAADRIAAQQREEAAQAAERADRELAEYRSALIAARRALEEAERKATADREALERVHTQAMADQRASHERALAIAHGEAVKVKAVADAEHHRAVTAKDAEHSRIVNELEAERARERRELTGERDELTRGLSSARDALKRSEGELASAVQTIADRNAELRSHAAAIEERDQRIAELRRDIEALEQDNTSYQDQVLRAYQKIKADEAMVARAKKAMAIALTVLDDEGKPKSEPT